MIEHIHEPYPESTMMARRDFAHVTKSPVVERPYWFRDTETGKEYHGIYGAIGWPTRVTERGDEMKGYACVVGVRKIKDQESSHARFDLLDEVEEESGSEDLLIQSCVTMRQRWGYGVHDDLIPVFYGDYRPFENVVAHFNTKIAEARGDEKETFIIAPSDDFDQANAFDIYLGRLRSVLAAKAKRLYIGKAETIKNRLQAFHRDDPCVMALGGLVHTLLIRQPWMEQTTPGMWQLPEV